jgi:hypothetical protein
MVASLLCIPKPTSLCLRPGQTPDPGHLSGLHGHPGVLELQLLTPAGLASWLA